MLLAALIVVMLPSSLIPAVAQELPDIRGVWDVVNLGVKTADRETYPQRFRMRMAGQGDESWTATIVASSACAGWTRRAIPKVSDIKPCRGANRGGPLAVTFDGERITIGSTWEGRVRVSDGVLTASGTWSAPSQGLSAAFDATLVEPLRPSDPAGGRRLTETLVICDREVPDAGDRAVLECTAMVADASGQPDPRPPTGRIAWTADSGRLGADSCTLVPGAGTAAACAVPFLAPTEELPIGVAPPVIATYSGDAVHAPSAGAPELYGAARGFTESDLYGPACNPASIVRVAVGCGDPIDPASGSLSFRTADLAITRSGLALAVVRSYDSAAAAAGVVGRFGRGWSDDHSAWLEEGPGRRDVTVHLGTGATVPFSRRGERITAPEWVTASLVRGPRNGWTLTFADQGRLVFDELGRLVAIVDRRDEPIGLTYGDDGALRSATDPAGQALTYTSDDDGRVTSVADAAGRTVRYEYDAAGDLVSVTDVAGAVTRYAYDADHRMTLITDATGATAATSYDAEGRVSGQVDPLGNTLIFEYLGAFPDLVTIVTDGAGVRQAFHYRKGVLVAETQALGTDVETTTHRIHDARLAEIAVVDPAGALWRTTRDDTGRVLTSTDPLGRTTSIVYDSDGDLVSTTSPMGLTTEIAYDGRKLLSAMTVAAGTPLEVTLRVVRDDPRHPAWVTAVVDETGATVTFGHDQAGRIVSVTDALGAALTMVRDEHGWVTSTTDPLGAAASVVRDMRGAVTSWTDPLGATGSLEQDAVGRLVGAIGPLDKVMALTRDEAGRTVSLELADGSTAGAAYDQRGSLRVQTNALGAVSTIEVDPLGRRTGWTDPLGNTWRWSYDAAGNRISATDPSGLVTRYVWDAAHQLLGIDYPDGTPDVTFGYDLDGRRVTMEDGTGGTTYDRDVLGRLTEVVDGSGRRVATSWDAAGRLAQLTYPDGLEVAYEYDRGGRMVAVRDSLGHDSRFEYDAAGRLISAVLGDGSVTTWTYDARGDPSTVEVVGKGPVLSVDYQRDAGRRPTQISDAATGHSGVSYDARGRLTSVGDATFEHDAGGGLTRLRDRSLRYDTAGRLVAEGPTAVTHEYDASGQRVSSSGARVMGYAWDGAGRLIDAGGSAATYDGDGTRATLVDADGTEHRFTWLRTGALPALLDDGTWRYVHGPTGPIAQIDDAGTVRWLHRDLTGSVRALTDETGTTTATFDWDAFGMPVGGTGEPTTRLGFHGRWTDPGTGLQVLPARVYDPATGQFLSVDPSVMRTHHPYAFAAGDPISATDPSGGEPEGHTVLAGHGLWHSDNGYVTVPDGTTVIFHQPAGSAMADSYGRDIESGKATRYVEVYGPGSRVPNYTLSPPDGLSTMSSSLTVQQDTQLSSLLMPGMGTVDWAACRIASGRDRARVKTQEKWTKSTTYKKEPDSPDADWGGLTTVTNWTLEAPQHEVRNGHVAAPAWGAEGPLFQPGNQPYWDPAWYEWESESLLPWRPS